MRREEGSVSCPWSVVRGRVNGPLASCESRASLKLQAGDPLAREQRTRPLTTNNGLLTSSSPSHFALAYLIRLGTIYARKGNPMADHVTRREFLQTSAAAAAALAVATNGFVARAEDKAEIEEDPQLQPQDGVPPPRQDRRVGVGRLHGRPLEAHRQVHRRQERQPLRAAGRARQLRQEPLRRRHPLHQARHQSHRRLHRRRGDGLFQGPQRPPREDVPRLFLVRE